MDTQKFINKYGIKNHDKTYNGYIWSELDVGHGGIIYKTKGTEDDAFYAASEAGYCGHRSQTFYILDPLNSQDMEAIEEWENEAEEL